jgi:acyl-coenzyme A thioesterase PaaI-like protein
MDITALPFNRLVGIERSTVAGTVLCLPADGRYANHLGTVHASALLALAEATSGECLISGLMDPGFEVAPVVRRIEAKFRRAATGAVRSRLGDMGDALAECRAALASRGRALITVPVEIIDASGIPALAANIEWFVAPRTGGSIGAQAPTRR